MKKQIQEKTREKIDEKGKKFARSTNLAKRFEEINKKGKENPKLFFLAIFISIIILFSISILSTKYLTRDNKQKIKEVNNIVNQNSSIEKKPGIERKNLQQEIKEFVSEFRDLGDSIQKIIKKENMTKEDTLFIMKKYAKWEEMKRFLDKEGIKYK